VTRVWRVAGSDERGSKCQGGGRSVQEECDHPLLTVLLPQQPGAWVHAYAHCVSTHAKYMLLHGTAAACRLMGVDACCCVSYRTVFSGVCPGGLPAAFNEHVSCAVVQVP
jgi:hypothetical protein